jgi:hypothetical protein
MGTSSEKLSPETFKQKINQLEEELQDLKQQLRKPHFFAASAEQDYEIKSKIIDKQNEMIELLLRQRDGK